MFFALGFLAMGLVGLMVLPAYWRRAERLVTARIETRMPLSMSEIVAERDALRAETAAKIRLMEMKSQNIREEQARDRIELGRSATSLEIRAREIDKAGEEIAILDNALRAARVELAQAEAARSATLKEAFDTEGLTTRMRNEYAELMGDHRQLQSQADSQRFSIAALETKAAGLEMNLEDARRALDQAARAHDEQARQAEHLQKVGEAYVAEREEVQRALARLQHRHDKALLRLTQLERQLAESRAEAADRAARLATEALRLANAEQLLAEADVRERHLQSALQRHSETARASDANLARRIEDLREELAVARAQPPAAAAANGYDSALDLAMLRQSIADVGAEMVRLHSAQAQGAAAGHEFPIHPKMPPLQGRGARLTAAP